MKWMLEYGSVSVCFDNWDSAFENLDLLSPKQTRRRRPHIKKLRRLARDVSLDLWSLDECHFQQHGTRCVMWVSPEDADPVLLHAPTRKSIALFGAVNLRHGQLVTQFDPKFDAVTFKKFLQKLLRYRRQGRRLLVILDNARYHHARLLAPFLHKHRSVLKLSFLPPYSPELNPIERVWKLTRRLSTHNQYFSHLHDLENAVSRQMAIWQKPNVVLHKLCCII